MPWSQQMSDETTPSHTHLIKMVVEYLYAFIAIAAILLRVAKVASRPAFTVSTDSHRHRQSSNNGEDDSE